MKQYIFQFGRFPKLSLLELIQKVPDFERISLVCPGFYQVAGEEIKNPQKFFDELGGSIRMLRKLQMTNEKLQISQNKQEFLADEIANYLDQNFPEGKIQFGLCVFPEQKSMTKDIALTVKKKLKEKGRSVRCINRNFQNLDAGTLHKENIFRKQNGAEILVLRQKNGDSVIAKTLAAQNVESFSERDYHKPERDMQVGMLPPKIALMMVNMASINGELPKNIWDPFCGTGTINIEAERLGIENTGSDISPKMIDAAQKNYTHFFGENGDFFVHDAARALPSQLTVNSHQLSEAPVVSSRSKDANFHNDKLQIQPDAIVSEGYLGPIFGQPLNEKDLQNARNKVEPIMRKFFRETENMKSIKKIVISLPFWKLRNGQDGFCEDALLEAKKYWKTKAPRDIATARGSLLYRRESQVVGREIFVLERRT